MKKRTPCKEIEVHWFDGVRYSGALDQAERMIELQEMMMLVAYNILEKLDL
jgi:hypothetical protein